MHLVLDWLHLDPFTSMDFSNMLTVSQALAALFSHNPPMLLIHGAAALAMKAFGQKSGAAAVEV